MTKIIERSDKSWRIKIRNKKAQLKVVLYICYSETSIIRTVLQTDPGKFPE